MKDYLKATLKIAVALFLAGTALIVVGIGIAQFLESREKEAARVYEVAKEWAVDLSSPLEMKVKAKTKLIGSKLHLAGEVEGYPEYLSHPALSSTNRTGRLVFVFLDADGFNVFEKVTTVADWNSVVDPQGERIGMSIQIDEYLSVDDYKRFEKMTMRWNLSTKFSESDPAPEVEKPEPADHCAPRLTKAERLKRLSQYGAVRETGMGEYSVGSKVVNFFADGSLMSCR
jgi:hypothetical protein